MQKIVLGQARVKVTIVYTVETRGPKKLIHEIWHPFLKFTNTQQIDTEHCAFQLFMLQTVLQNNSNYTNDYKMCQKRYQRWQRKFGVWIVWLPPGNWCWKHPRASSWIIEGEFVAIDTLFYPDWKG